MYKINKNLLILLYICLLNGTFLIYSTNDLPKDCKNNNSSKKLSTLYKTPRPLIKTKTPKVFLDTDINADIYSTNALIDKKDENEDSKTTCITFLTCILNCV